MASVRASSFTGETEIARLLADLRPVLSAGDYVFCTFENADYGAFANLEPIAAMLENEGLTLVIPLAVAKKNHIPYSSVFKQISLTIHSSLDAVGLTAAFSTALAAAGMSANVIAGYYHDHIFVQREHAKRAMAVLADLSE